ncbi:MAG: cupin domain-containing protein [Chloroflexi bacterium]|nr:cupin domain-containing protein [Chloroflexota bacterium]
MKPKQLGPGEGEILEQRIVKITPAENGGSYLQFETSHASGTNVPAHFHHDEDEAFYVLAGQYEFLVGETHFTATTGTFAFAPRGTVHAFTNTGQEIGRLLITVTPGTQHEGLMREVATLTEQRGKPLELPEVAALALKYGWVWVQ